MPDNRQERAQRAPQTTACNLCGQNRPAPWQQAQDWLHHTPGSYTYVICQACGLIYMNPRPHPQEMGRFYPASYGPYQSGRLRARPRQFWKQVHHRLWQSPVNRLYGSLPAGGRLLEVGCGSGGFLLEAQQMGWQVSGIEPGLQAVQAARSQGLDVAHGTLDSVQPEGRFDLVRLSFVLEHVHDPALTLAQVAGLLKPGGRAHISVPNAASACAGLFGRCWYDLDAPRHLYLFNPATLAGLCAKAGLRVEQTVGEINTYVFWKSLGYWLEARQAPHGLRRGVETWGSKLSLPLSFGLGWALARRLKTSRLHVIAAPANTGPGV